MTDHLGDRSQRAFWRNTLVPGEKLVWMSHSYLPPTWLVIAWNCMIVGTLAITGAAIYSVLPNELGGWIIGILLTMHGIGFVNWLRKDVSPRYALSDRRLLISTGIVSKSLVSIDLSKIQVIRQLSSFLTNSKRRRIGSIIIKLKEGARSPFGRPKTVVLSRVRNPQFLVQRVQELRSSLAGQGL
ncbi:MAG: PH domain-containing protein [Pseudomonadota bacterium]